MTPKDKENLHAFRTPAALLVALGAALAGVQKSADAEARSFVMVPQADGSAKLEYLERPEKPHRHRGVVTAHDVDSFVAVVTRFAEKKDAVIYAQVKPAGLICVLNDNRKDAAGWRDHRVSFTLGHSDAFTAWIAENGVSMLQQEFAEFIEERIHDFLRPEGGRMLELALNFKAKTEATFRSGMRQQDGTVAFEYTETVNAAAGVAGKLMIPESFVIKMPVWSGLDQTLYEFKALLRYRLTGGKLTFFYKLEQPERTVEKAFAETLNAVRQKVKEVPVVFGNPGN